MRREPSQLVALDDVRVFTNVHSLVEQDEDERMGLTGR